MRAVGAKSSLMIYCFFLRKYPSVHVFFVSLDLAPQHGRQVNEMHVQLTRLVRSITETTSSSTSSV